MGNEIIKYADGAMFEAAPMKRDDKGLVTPKVTLLWATPDPLGAIAAACNMYEGTPTYSLDDLSGHDRKRHWENVQKTHLKAPLEFVKMHFFIEGVTRAFTHQMVRQRTAVYAQESLRFAVKDGFASEVALPPSLQGLKDDDPKMLVWNEAVCAAERAYMGLVGAGVPAEDARGLLPHSVTTRLNYCTDLRALMDHAGNRLCTQAQLEWRQVFTQILLALRAADTLPEPGHHNMIGSAWHIITDPMYAAFAPVCYAKGKCPFKAEFDRGCTIRERADRGAFDEINPAEWMLDRKAAWVK